MSDLAAWDSFFIIVGLSAGALIGLQFVVMTLIAERSPPRGEEAGPAFATPTIVHFGAVLLLSAVLSAPWQEVTFVAAILGLMGLIGVVYIIIVARKMRMQTAYEPEFGDWLYYALLPLAAYAMLAISAITALSHTHEALFSVGAATLLLLFIGIYNAWDSVAYLVFYGKQNMNNKRG
jgi:L-asparagine transporter-like permease